MVEKHVLELFSEKIRVVNMYRVNLVSQMLTQSQWMWHGGVQLVESWPTVIKFKLLFMRHFLFFT